MPTILVFHSVDTWQLVINTATSVAAFLLVALLQNSERRKDEATLAKLNTLAAALAAVMRHVADGDREALTETGARIARLYRTRRADLVPARASRLPPVERTLQHPSLDLSHFTARASKLFPGPVLVALGPPALFADIRTARFRVRDAGRLFLALALVAQLLVEPVVLHAGSVIFGHAARNPAAGG